MSDTFNDLLGDVFDIRDVIERYEELEENECDDDEKDEFNEIKSFLESVEGNGGDQKWRGSWYPVSFIRDSYFEEYAEELAEDTGAISRDMQWPLNCIDWEQATNELKVDYSSVEIGGTTYWYR